MMETRKVMVVAKGAARMGEFPELEVIFSMKDKRLVAPVEGKMKWQ